MKTWFENKWDLFRTNFLFLPLLMSGASVVFFLGLTVLDSHVDLPASGPARWLRAGSAAGVRALLTAMVGALVTALSVVFSITIVALTLAASQLGPRLLRNFMRDRGNQVILGVFVSTFLYCLLALRLVGRTDAPDQLPHITVLGAFVLACAAFGVLIYFIHHVARSIQAPSVITSVCAELESEIERIFPEPSEDDDTAPEPPSEKEFPPRQGLVTSDWDGYLQAIDVDGLIEVACRADVILRVLRRPGHFLVRGEPLVEVHSATEVEEEMDYTAQAIRRSLVWGQLRSTSPVRKALPPQTIRRSLILGKRRTATQDIEFVMLQLVEIAVRALSPGINDPITAMTCIDRLSAVFCRIARRRMPRAHHYDETGNLRLILNNTDFEGLCNAAFDQIRQHARSDAAVLIRLLEGLHRIAKQARTDNQRAAIWRQAEMVHRAAMELPEPLDRQSAKERFLAIKGELPDSVERGTAQTGAKGSDRGKNKTGM